MKTVFDYMTLIFEIPVYKINPFIKKRLVESVQSHKYFLNLKYSKQMLVTEAISSYGEYCFSPFYEFYNKNNLHDNDVSLRHWDHWSEIVTTFLNVLDHWHFMKEQVKTPPISIKDATISYYLKYRETWLKENNYFTFLKFKILSWGKVWT